VLIVQAVTEVEVPDARLAALTEAATWLSEAVGTSSGRSPAALRMTKIAAINEAGVNIISTLDLSGSSSSWPPRRASSWRPRRASSGSWIRKRAGTGSGSITG